MANAIIKFTQGLSSPPAGEALEGVTGVAVVCTNGDNTGIATWLWQLIDVPPGSILSTGTISTSSSAVFTPDVPGGYQVRLTTVDGSANTYIDNRAVLVPEDGVYGRIIAPFSATADALNIGGQTRGWAPFMEDYLHVIDRIGDWSSSAAAAGNSIVWDAVSKFWKPITMAALTASLVVASFPPGSNGQILTTTAGATGWAAAPTSGINQLTGDVLAGPGSGSQVATVVAIHGASVPVAGSLTTGNSLHVSGASALSYSALNLAGGAGWVTGQLPVANVAPGTAAQLLVTNSGATVPAWVTMSGGATMTAAGVVTLSVPTSTAIAGEVTGTLAASVVSGPFSTASWVWNSGLSVVFGQTVGGATSTGHDWTFSPQAGGATSGVPGAFIVNIAAPNGGSAENWVKIERGGTLLAQLGPYTAFPSTIFAIYPGGLTPSAANYAFYATTDGTTAGFGAGSSFHFDIAGANALILTSNTLSWGFAVSSPTYTQAALGSDVAAADLLFSPQSPFGTATVHKAPGNYVIQTPLPITGANFFGGLVWNRGDGTPGWRVGYYGGPDLTYTGMWFEDAGAPNGSNYAFLGTANRTDLNSTTIVSLAINSAYALSLTGSASLSFVANANITGSLTFGTTVASSTLKLQSGVATPTLTLDGDHDFVQMEVAILQWKTGQAPVIQQATSAGDGSDFSITAQFGASGHIGGRLILAGGNGGSSFPGGDLLLYSGAGGAGSTAGSIFLSPGGVANVLEIDVIGSGSSYRTTSIGQWCYNHVSKSGNYTIDSAGNADFMISVTAALTLTMPTPRAGRMIVVNVNFALGAASLTFARHAAEKINGVAASLVLNASQAASSFKPLVVTSDGTDWFVGDWP